MEPIEVHLRKIFSIRGKFSLKHQNCPKIGFTVSSHYVNPVKRGV